MDDPSGLTFGLLVTSFWFGFRHGIDWDHLAAIADITSSQEERRRALWLGTLYVLGHAAVVLVLGLIAIAFGRRLPGSVDDLMGRIVGATLVALGAYVFISLVRHGRDFRLRSRWMLVFRGVGRGTRWLRGRGRGEGDDASVAVLDRAEEDDAPVAVLDRAEGAPHGDPATWHHGHHGRPGHHHHGALDAHEREVSYGDRTALGVGMLHGIGAETPTQVVIFITAAGAGGLAAGVAVLVAFLVGLVLANSIITVGSALGFLNAARNFGVYATVAVITGVASIAIGVIFLLGLDSVLPGFFSV